MEYLDVLYEILLLICQWWNIEHPGLFLMKIHPVKRKLYQIINGGTTALVYDESYLTLRGMHSWLNPLCNYSLSAINRLIACLHFRVQRDYKMPRNLGVMGIDRGLNSYSPATGTCSNQVSAPGKIQPCSIPVLILVIQFLLLTDNKLI